MGRFPGLLGALLAFAAALPAAAQPSPVPPKPAAALPQPAARSDAYALFLRGRTHSRGPFTGADRVQARHHGKPEPFIWVRRAGRTYIIRDPATVGAIRGLFRSPLHSASPSDYRRVDLLERDLALRWRIGQTVAESEQVTERIERLRDPSMTNEDPSVIPGGLEGLRSRLEDERSRLAEESVRLNSQRAEMERRLMQLEPPPPSPATGCAQDVWTLLDEAITRGLAEPIPQR